MPRVSATLLAEAFISPIRFALLIDDQFPIYSKIAEANPLPAQDSARAVKLFEFCRDRGWLCDIDNAAHPNDELKRVDRLHQSDLLVLDFHLDPAKKDDPSAALRILQRLARSEHFNLVVIYTAAHAASVVRDVAFCLGGGVAVENSEAAIKALDDMDPDPLEKSFGALNDVVLDNYLSGRNPNGSANGMRAELAKAEIKNGALQRDVINVMCGQRMTERVTKSVAEARPPSVRVQGSFGTDGGVQWVTQGNVFAVVIDKKEDPAVFIERLTAALVAWDPPALQVMMAHARASLEKAGRLPDEEVLETPRRQAGWLLRILLGRDAAERREFVGELYARLFGRLVRAVSTSITDFGSRVIEPVKLEARLEQAKAMALGGETLKDVAVYHSLNEHLCSEDYGDGPMTTGVVFRTKGSRQMLYWVCTSPACDLVPGQNLKGWDGDLDPLRPITAARLNLIKDMDSIATLLKSATFGRHVFMYIDGEAIALEVVDADARQMRLETILLDAKGVIKNRKFKGHTLQRKDQLPVAEAAEFEVVGALRSDYANRLLAESGHQRARIGVDFVNFE